jgi:hypothetical protein
MSASMVEQELLRSTSIGAAHIEVARKRVRAEEKCMISIGGGVQMYKELSL